LGRLGGRESTCRTATFRIKLLANCLNEKIFRAPFSAPDERVARLRPVALRKQCRFCQIRHEAAGAGAPQSGAAGFRSHHLPGEHDPVPVEDEYRHDRFLDWRSRGRQQSGAKCKKLLGRQLDFELRRVRFAGYRFTAELHPGFVCSAAESFLLRAALQRRDARAIQAGSGSGDSLVQAGLYRTRPFGVQGPLACRSQG